MKSNYMDFGPDRSIKLRFFEEGIEKLIKDKNTLSSEVLDWLVDQAWYSWVLGITKEELQLLSIFEKICVDLFKLDYAAAEIVFRAMYNAIPEAEDRSASVREMTQQKMGTFDESSPSKRIREILSEYNSLYENDFKVWATPIYACSIYIFKNHHQVKDYKNVVHVPSATKIQSIKEIKSTEYGDMSVFIKGFDNEIRNAGVGHESFEINDDGSFSLRVTNPYTGEIKGTGIIKLTEGEIKKLVDEMRKTLWFFRVGLNIFFANNRHLVEKIAVLEEMKIRDIKKEMDGFCDNRCLKIESFTFDDKSDSLSISMKYEPKILGENSQVYIGTGEAWDLIKREMIVPYRDQIIGCVFHIIRLFSTRETGIPDISLLVKDENGKEVMDLEYDKIELIRFLSEYKVPPKPSKGNYYEGKYKMEYHVRVPYGTAKIMKPFIDRLDHD